MKLEKLQAGRAYYTVERRKMGNTTLSCDAVYMVRVIVVHTDGATVSWNSNRQEYWSPRRLTKLRGHPPEWVRNPLDGTRCYVCGKRKNDGHSETCMHPRAVAARKRAAKAEAAT